MAVENPAFKVRDVIEAAASDADVLIRKWAFTFAQSEMLDAWPELRTRAARDPFSPIRRIAFDSLNAETAPPTDQLLAFLLDSSPAIRHSAQDQLPKLLNIPVGDYYRATIDAGRGARSISALGLAEVGDATDAPMIAVLMHDSSAKTRAAAIRALRLLNIVDIDALIKAINSDVPSVAREAVVSLLRGHLLPPDLIWKEALENRDPIVWRTVLTSFNTAGKWIQLRVYLEAIATNDDSVSAFAIERVRIWLAQYNRSFTLPDASESGQISSLLAGVRHKLPVEVGRELGFVIETVLKPAHNARPSATRSDVR